MATFIESLVNTFTPDLIGKIAGSTGFDSNLVTKGIGAAGPLLTGAMASRSASPTGLDGLLKLIPADGGAALGNIASMIAGGSGVGNLLGGIFGVGQTAVESTLDKSIGFKASKLLPILAPAAMALLSKVRSEKQLDSAGVARYLQDEQRAFQARGGEAVTLVDAALKAGAEVQKVRDSFTDDEWRTVRLAPMAAAQVVMMSSPSGPIGTLKEAGSVAKIMTEGHPDAPDTSILAIAWKEHLSMDELQSLGGKGTTKEALLQHLKSAVSLVAARSPGDATNYRRFITNIATKVAEASKEGGFLGIGGTLVSDEERKALEELGTAIA